jgi:aryl-alcohol dehydrogenase (NADP+)
MYAWQFMKMLATSKANGWTPFVSMQPQYNLVYREEEREMLPLCLDQGVGVIPWSPLARGFLAGGRANPGEGNTERARSDEFSPRLYYREPDHAVVAEVEKVAKARGAPNTQVALAWVLRNPAITAPIVGTTKPHHLDDAIAGLNLTLTDDEVTALEAPYQPKPVLDHA